MRKLTISALIAVGFFASDVAANSVSRVATLYRQDGDFCQTFHRDVCKDPKTSRPPPGKPDLCNDQVCHDFISANPDFLGCISGCAENDRECSDACFPAPPSQARRRVVRRQPPPHGPQGGPPKPAGPNNHGPQNGPGDFCASLEQLCQAGPIERFRRRQDNNANANANGNGNGNGHGDNDNGEQGPNLCDRETCDGFIQECPSFPPCVHNCKEGDQDCVEQCFECNGEGHQEAPARRRQPPPHPQGGNGAPHPAGGNHPGPQGPPPQLPPPEGDFCLSLNELCQNEGPAPAEARIHRRRQEEEGQAPEGNHAEGNGDERQFPLCDLDTCDAFLVERPCFPKCVHECAVDDEKCVEKCFECPPERLRRRRAVRKSHN